MPGYDFVPESTSVEISRHIHLCSLKLHKVVLARVFLRGIFNVPCLQGYHSHCSAHIEEIV